MSTPLLETPRVRLDDPFWNAYRQLVRDVVIPYQWEALNDRVDAAEPSHALDNFRIAAGQRQGEHHGMVFQDSDVTKWLEAVAYQLAQAPDPALEATADEVIALCVDGSVDLARAAELAAAGVSEVVVGSALFKGNKRENLTSFLNTLAANTPTTLATATL